MGVGEQRAHAAADDVVSSSVRGRARTREGKREDVARQIELLAEERLGGEPAVGALRGSDVVVRRELAADRKVSERDAPATMGTGQTGRMRQPTAFIDTRDRGIGVRRERESGEARDGIRGGQPAQVRRHRAARRKACPAHAHACACVCRACDACRYACCVLHVLDGRAAYVLDGRAACAGCAGWACCMCWMRWMGVLHVLDALDGRAACAGCAGWACCMCWMGVLTCGDQRA
jgi:hypothetical protein